MGVPSVTGQEFHTLTPPSMARTPSGGVPETTPKEAIQTYPDASRPGKVDAKDAKKVESSPLIQRTETRMHVDEATKRIVTQIVDENNQVIRQIPPQELLDLAAHMQQLEGLLFDRNV